MEKPSQSIRELAIQIIEAEARAGGTSTPAALVCEKLRVTLTRFAGAASFSALMRRSIALSHEEIPALKDVKVGPDGCVEGLDSITAGSGAGSASVVTAHLLWLLVTFMGESIAMRLVHDAWPDLQPGDNHEGGR